MNVVRLIILSLLIVLLGACSKASEDEEALKPYQGMSVDELYKYAVTAMDKGDNEAAIKRFEALDSIYPFNKYSKQAGYDLIYLYFKDEQYPLAVAQADRFIRVYPQDSNVDYAYYIKAVANFEQERGAFAKLFEMDYSLRDPGTQMDAYNDFKRLIHLFPNSRYANDSRQRMIYLRNQFAQRELNIAEYYQVRKEYVAAYNRAKIVVTTYPQAPQARKALLLMIDSSQALKLTQANHDARAIYQANYGGTRRTRG
jgi:outer membrane protein assembly factor BamD